MQEVFRCVAGSRLFGTNTPESDVDYKAIAIPTAKDILLGKATYSVQNTTGSNRERNGADDVDVTIMSLQKYVNLLMKMETNAIEMMFAPSLVQTSLCPVAMLRENRFKVLSANKAGFLGFGKNQAMKYAVRGERKTSIERLCAALGSVPQTYAIRDSAIPDFIRAAHIPGVSIIEKPQPGGVLLDFISAFGREMPVTCKVGEALKVFEKPLLEIGNRTAAAAENGGADWKGLYHAQRIIDEGLELFKTGELKYPCEFAQHYLCIRKGLLPLDQVLDYFEDRLQELEELTPISDFPEAPDIEWAQEFIYSFHEQVVVEAYHEWKAA